MRFQKKKAKGKVSEKKKWGGSKFSKDTKDTYSWEGVGK